jgi:hypothetical protein
MIAILTAVQNGATARRFKRLERFPIERNRSIDQNSLERKKARALFDPNGSESALAEERGG